MFRSKSDLRETIKFKSLVPDVYTTVVQHSSTSPPRSNSSQALPVDNVRSVEDAGIPSIESIAEEIEGRSKACQLGPSFSYGHIQLIVGPMFSGKSTELLRRMRRYGCAKKRTLHIKYKFDNRYTADTGSSLHLITHDKQFVEASPCVRLEEVEKSAEEFDCIGIDEGQFFADIIEFSEKMANIGKIVIVAALDGTFQRKPFGRINELFHLAEYVTKLSAVCSMCGKDAFFTLRLSAETEVEVIGGADKYVAACRACYSSCTVHPEILHSSDALTSHTQPVAPSL
mmetsp:Transcript_19123/g.31286  ORF Transcript_19123/g.31286 Transcript_19123/m.31286 type:complete len:285 (+) Transcript_19123:161-1015(+)|eukprot:CAMPEP_0184663098 /NCGR_PEP_ID=MMETSP0308-20130426/46556_1 /TAXON_ID=38269 /ORGANISM="Gloeochaete witrockiana, Strain SAG 46.84" /LENGTH=284 /DNA_ID=CAMNT_0027105597 /DNA_START=142 /DNA_END=996 /DNA_ORIENTATION=-